jgi:hypothetical protein
MRFYVILVFTGAVIFSLRTPASIINIPDDYNTIQEGVDVSVDGDTVLVQSGTYVENINFNGHNIVLGSLFLTTDDTSYISQTIIDGDSSGSVVAIISGEDNNTILCGFTIQSGFAASGGGIFISGSNPVITSNVIQYNEAFETNGGYGGGIACIYSNAIITDNRIRHNYASGPLGGFGGGIYIAYSLPSVINNVVSNNLGDWGGGGFYVYFSTLTINNNIIVGNTGSFGGGGLYLNESSPYIVNNVISGNEASWTAGGGIYGENNSNPIIVNSIIWLNEALEGEPDIMIAEGIPTVAYCNIFGGWAGEGNTSLDPHFRNPNGSDFHLMATYCGDSEDSPLIDMGHPDIIDSLLDCDWGLGGLGSDMGAYGGGDSIQVEIENPTMLIPHEIVLYQNYPNPFNAITLIKYELPVNTHVFIDIYDILGRKVATVQDGSQSAGYHEVIWNADDLSSGVYLYKLRGGDFIEARKMLLLR